MADTICKGTGEIVGIQDNGLVRCAVCRMSMDPIATKPKDGMGLVPPHRPYLMQEGDITIEGADLENFKEATAKFAFGMTRREAMAKKVCLAGHPYEPKTGEEIEEYKRSALCLEHLDEFSRGEHGGQA